VNIETLVLTPYQANCYLVDAGETRIVIDPGEADGRLRAALKSRAPTAVVCTHAHPDHVEGVPWVLEAYGVPLYMHPGGDALLAQFAPEIETFSALRDGGTLSLGPLDFRVLHVPGHAPDQVILIGEAERVIFAADLVFAGSVGRTDFPLCDPAAMEGSLRRLLDLEGDYTLYPGHGPATTLARERETNPFLTPLRG